MSYDKTGFPGWAVKELSKKGYAPQNVMDRYIPEWWQWYAASAGWYKEYAGDGKGKCMTMHPARKVCDEFEWLMLDGEVAVSCAEDGAVSEWLEVRGPALVKSLWGFVSRYMALGTGALAIDLAGVAEGRSELARATVRRYDADEVCPIVATDEECASAAFCRDVVVNGRKYSQLQVHEPEGGQYVVRTWMYEQGGGDRIEARVEGILEEVHTCSPVPTFRLVTPSAANDLEPGTPMGVSVFAGCVDQLKDVDAKYDDWHWTPRMCRPRLVVDERGQIRDPKTGELRYNDTIDARVYNAVAGYGDHGIPVTVVNPDPRVDQLERALSTALGTLGDAVGLGSEYWSIDSGKVSRQYKTATEVASGNQRLMRVVQRHEAVLGSAMAGILEAAWCCELGLHQGRVVAGEEVPDVSVSWDDSIMEDDASKRATMKDDIARGLCPPELYLVEYYGMTEEEARAFVNGAELPEE